MTAVLVVAVVVVVWRGDLATRLTRADRRVQRTWRGLDDTLRGRADAAVAALGSPGTDPAVALLVADAAGTAREPGLDRGDRERAESDLTQVINLTGLADLERETEQVVLRRRLHNDAVVRTRALRSRRSVRLLGLRGLIADPTPFEMADPGLRLRS